MMNDTTAILFLLVYLAPIVVSVAVTIWIGIVHRQAQARTGRLLDMSAIAMASLVPWCYLLESLAKPFNSFESGNYLLAAAFSLISLTVLGNSVRIMLTRRDDQESRAPLVEGLRVGLVGFVFIPCLWLGGQSFISRWRDYHPRTYEDIRPYLEGLAKHVAARTQGATHAELERVIEDYVKSNAPDQGMSILLPVTQVGTTLFEEMENQTRAIGHSRGLMPHQYLLTVSESIPGGERRLFIGCFGLRTASGPEWIRYFCEIRGTWDNYSFNPDIALVRDLDHPVLRDYGSAKTIWAHEWPPQPPERTRQVREFFVDGGGYRLKVQTSHRGTFQFSDEPFERQWTEKEAHVLWEVRRSMEGSRLFLKYIVHSWNPGVAGYGQNIPGIAVVDLPQRRLIEFSRFDFSVLEGLPPVETTAAGVKGTPLPAGP